MARIVQIIFFFQQKSNQKVTDIDLQLILIKQGNLCGSCCERNTSAILKSTFRYTSCSINDFIIGARNMTTCTRTILTNAQRKTLSSPRFTYSYWRISTTSAGVNCVEYFDIKAKLILILCSMVHLPPGVVSSGTVVPSNGKGVAIFNRTKIMNVNKTIARFILM